MKRFIIICLLPLMMPLAGCHILHQGEDGVERDWLGREKVIEFQSPTKIVAIWSNSVFSAGGSVPIRGLGGRVYFYDAEHHPIQVDGKLSVYLYDDSDVEVGDPLEQEATRVVHFTEDQVQSNYSPSDFGASYSFWLPWDQVGGERKQLSIIPVFTDSAGRMVVGEQARQFLPGSDPVKVIDENGEEVEVVPASHTEHTTITTKVLPPGEKPKDVSGGVLGKTSTIKVHKSMQDRLTRPQPRRLSSFGGRRTVGQRREGPGLAVARPETLQPRTRQVTPVADRASAATTVAKALVTNSQANVSADSNGSNRKPTLNSRIMTMGATGELQPVR